MNLAI